jgi:hypothetical protein
MYSKLPHDTSCLMLLLVSSDDNRRLIKLFTLLKGLEWNTLVRKRIKKIRNLMVCQVESTVVNFLLHIQINKDLIRHFFLKNLQ